MCGVHAVSPTKLHCIFSTSLWYRYISHRVRSVWWKILIIINIISETHDYAWNEIPCIFALISELRSWFPMSWLLYLLSPFIFVRNFSCYTLCVICKWGKKELSRWKLSRNCCKNHKNIEMIKLFFLSVLYCMVCYII